MLVFQTYHFLPYVAYTGVCRRYGVL